LKQRGVSVTGSRRQWRSPSRNRQNTLQYAVEEADRLNHDYIGSEHLLLGLLRVDGSRAASILASHHVKLEATRDEIIKLLNVAGNKRDRDDTTHPIERIQHLLSRYAGRLPDNAEARELIERIQRDLEALKRLFD
jgi:ATP-dependent Clp protease ATP-binding subunit ClpC